ncbi:MAG TPA: sigma-70 family RNA polymerase sigma factor [Anaerolineae bacterium]|nr:sigma-70 family RNA polymerase sigma factor [Anaerolineae bacterium]
MAGRSNEQWIRALSERSTEAQGAALQDLHDFLLRAVLTYLAAQRGELGGWSQGDVRGLAEDLAQDALVEITRSLTSFRGDSKFTTWAYRFVINRAVSELRRQRYRNISLDRLREEQGGSLFQAVITDREKIEPEQLAEQSYYLNLLRDILTTELNERQRSALLAVYDQGRSMDEVANALGVSRNALYKLLHDARRRIKARLAARHLSESDILSAFED